jgi:hypothetical protein
MSTDIVKLEAEALPVWMKNAEALAGANLLPPQYRQAPANILLAIQTGAPLGFGAMESIQGINVISGKPSMSADLIQAAVRKAGHKLRVTGDDTYAEAVLIRADDPDFQFKVRWDMARAKAAGLTGKDNWKHYPAAMLRSRAITEVARMGAADALHGVIYAPEELGATVDQSGEVVSAPAAAQKPSAPKAEAMSPERWEEWSGYVKAAKTKAELRVVYQDAGKAGVLPLIVPDVDVPFSQLLQEVAHDLPDEAEPEVATAEVIEGEPWPEEATHA